MNKGEKIMSIKKLILMLIIMTLILAPIQTYASQNTVDTNYSNSPINPWDYAEKLGKGLDVDWSKTKDGEKYYNTQTVKDFRTMGIDHVRIRVKDDISQELFNGLDKQIQDCLDNNIVPIIAYQADDLKNSPTDKNLDKAINWWKQVSEHYSKYSYLLGFDLIIEVTDALNKQPDRLNEIYEKLVNAIREDNPNRILMISPRIRSNPEYLNELKIPTASNGYLMAEWHFYAAGPSKTNKEKLWTTGTAAEKKAIIDKINLAQKWQKANNIPTWVGAWMPGNYNDENNYKIDEQVNFATFMTNALSDAKVPFSVNSDTKFYDRKNNSWIEDMKPVFNAIYSNSTTTFDKEIDQNQISVGFNAKATLDTAEQCSYISKEFDNLRIQGVKTDKIWLRITGGTISQTTKPSDWTDDMIEKWAKLQKEFGCQYIFVVNFNDAPESQLAFYNRLGKGGIGFDAIELGNEQYLRKFTEANTGAYHEVTERTSNMTPQKYIQMSNEYMKLFKDFGLPFYVQFAPQNDNKEEYIDWNKSIAKAINDREFLDENIYGSIHLYERKGDGSLEAGQIDNIRSLMKPPINFAVTESGVIKENLSYNQFIEQEKNLTKRILGKLRDGDIFLNQVLYTDYKKVGPEVLHPQYKGITPKGEAIIELLKKYW
jgi:hypothetical protein